MRDVVFAAVLTVTGAVGGWCAHAILTAGSEFASYEAGAHAVMLHHKTKGNYGSGVYRRRAFEWGSPQNERDIDAIIETRLEPFSRYRFVSGNKLGDNP